jgi:hypothetical protein
MAKKVADLLPGTLDMLILKAVSLKPLHEHDIVEARAPLDQRVCCRSS